RAILLDVNPGFAGDPATERVDDLEAQVDVDGTDLPFGADRELAPRLAVLGQMVEYDDGRAVTSEDLNDRRVEALDIDAGVRVEAMQCEGASGRVDHDQRRPALRDQRGNVA